jgi:hypothetical protein
MMAFSLYVSINSKVITSPPKKCVKQTCSIT